MNIVYTTWFTNARGTVGICVTREPDDMPRAFISQVEGKNEQLDKQYIVEHGSKLYVSTVDKMVEAHEEKKEFQYLFTTAKGDICVVMYVDKTTNEMKSYISPVYNINANADLHETTTFGAKLPKTILDEIQHKLKDN